MKNELLDEMNEILKEVSALGRTENGALGYKETGHALLDLEFAVSSLRGADEEDIGELFLKAWAEDRVLALRWACYARDVRGGLGERRLFRCILKTLAGKFPEAASALVPLVPEYGRYDDLFVLFGTEAERAMISFIVKTLRRDLANARARDALAEGREGNLSDFPLTLLGKWMPSVNASSRETRALALKWARILGMDAKHYRKALSLLRRHLRVVERDMCANEWDGIDYGRVPSRASLLYAQAFRRHDEERYVKYLAAVEEGRAVIHSGALFPYEICARYRLQIGEFYRLPPNAALTPDATLEALWKALPAPEDGGENILVVRDGSGSMWTGIPGGSAAIIDVATAMAIYCAEHIRGDFHDKFLTFSESPKFVDLDGCGTLAEKLLRTFREDECANTDIAKTFRLLLSAAVRKKLPQEGLPGTLLIISDMEFDGNRFHWDTPLFETLRKEYEEAGYKLPRLVFWNVGSRTGVIPTTKNELGLILVSGFSAQVYDMVTGGDLDPYQALCRVLRTPRYDPAEAALASVSA